MKVFVSLTTIPSRLPQITRTINSLVNQSRKPDKIFLNIPRRYNLRFKHVITDDMIPKFDSDLVEVVRCVEDYGPGTKLMGNINFLKAEKDAIVILVDDDFAYDPRMVEQVEATISKNKHIGTAGAMKHIMNYYIGAAWQSFAFPTHFLSKIDDFYKLIRHDPQILHHDDYWISFYLHYMGIRKLIKLKLNNINVQHDKDALSRIQTAKFKRSTLDDLCFKHFTSQEFLTKINKVYGLNKRVIEFTPDHTLVAVYNYKQTTGRPMKLLRQWIGPPIYKLA